MLSYLDGQTKLTGNQRRIVLAAMLGDMLDFLDYYLIGYVVAFIARPWNLTFGQSGVLLLSPGMGGILGAAFYGRLADRIGRRKVFMLTVLNASIATGMLAFTPERNWFYLIAFLFFVGFGVAGLYSVDLPLVLEFVPASKRGQVSGLVTSTIPLGLLLASTLAATVTPYVGWRGLFAIGTIPAVVALLVRMWVPESPRWLLLRGRTEDARRSVAWALEMDPADLPAAAHDQPQQPVAPWTDLLRYPRSLVVSCIANLGAQTGAYSLKLWSPTLVALILGVTPEGAAFLLIWVNLAGFAGRIMFSFLSDTLGRRISVGLYGLGACTLLVTAALAHNVFIGTVSVFWLLLIVAELFVDGGWAVIAPYSGEVWPANLRTTGMGTAYGFGGLGKVVGPLALAWIVGSSNVVRPQASVGALLPAYFFLASCFAVVGVVFLAFARETRGYSLETIEQELGATAAVAPIATGPADSRTD